MSDVKEDSSDTLITANIKLALENKKLKQFIETITEFPEDNDSLDIITIQSQLLYPKTLASIVLQARALLKELQSTK